MSQELREAIEARRAYLAEELPILGLRVKTLEDELKLCAQFLAVIDAGGEVPAAASAAKGLAEIVAGMAKPKRKWTRRILPERAKRAGAK